MTPFLARNFVYLPSLPLAMTPSDLAGRVLHQLHGGHAEEELHAGLLGHLGQGAHAVAGGVGLGPEERRDVVQRVAVDLADRELRAAALVDDLCAALLGAVDDPADGLAGVVGPLPDERRVAAVVVVVDELGDQRLDAGLVAGGQVDAGAGVALRHGHRVLLDHRDLGAVLGRRQGRRNTRGAGTDDDDVEGQRLLDVRVGDRLRLRQEGQRRAAVGALGEVAAVVRRRAGSLGGSAGQPERADARGAGRRARKEAPARDAVGQHILGVLVQPTWSPAIGPCSSFSP